MKPLYLLASRRALILYSLLALMIFSFTASGQQIAKTLIAKNNVQIGFYEYKPVDYPLYPAKRYPLIIFLHGIGERGNGTSEITRVATHGIPKLIREGATMKFNGETFLVLSPQLPTWLGAWENYFIDEMLNHAKQNLQVDTNRMYLTGLSLGGGGVWSYTNTSAAHAKRFAAIAPVCGTCFYDYMTLGSTIGAATLGVWGFANMDDGIVSPWCTISACDALVNTSSIVRKTINPSGGHDAWSKAYDMGTLIQTPNLYQWMLGFTKASMQVLPVKVSLFTVTHKASGREIKWKADNEDKNGAYEVEHSTNGKNFSLLTRLKADAGPLYSFVDYNNITATSYYRLKIISADGQSAYSPTVEVKNQYSGSYSVSLFDVTGRLIAKKKDANVQEFIAGITRNGIYVLHVNDGRSITTSRISINK